jgi:hypothetical protein
LLWRGARADRAIGYEYLRAVLGTAQINCRLELRKSLWLFEYL